jgi:hypothetical protein
MLRAHGVGAIDASRRRTGTAAPAPAQEDDAHPRSGLREAGVGSDGLRGRLHERADDPEQREDDPAQNRTVCPLRSVARPSVKTATRYTVASRIQSNI